MLHVRSPMLRPVQRSVQVAVRGLVPPSRRAALPLGPQRSQQPSSVTCHAKRRKGSDEPSYLETTEETMRALLGPLHDVLDSNGQLKNPRRPMLNNW